MTLKHYGILMYCGILTTPRKSGAFGKVFIQNIFFLKEISEITSKINCHFQLLTWWVQRCSVNRGACPPSIPAASQTGTLTSLQLPSSPTEEKTLQRSSNCARQNTSAWLMTSELLFLTEQQVRQWDRRANSLLLLSLHIQPQPWSGSMFGSAATHTAWRPPTGALDGTTCRRNEALEGERKFDLWRHEYLKYLEVHSRYSNMNIKRMEFTSTTSLPAVNLFRQKPVQLSALRQVCHLHF